MQKSAVISAMLAKLVTERDGLARMTQAARDEATHGESRPENQYDTRALEASYLAAGQGKRLMELRQLIAWMETPVVACRTARPGALLHLEADTGETRWLLMAPAGGLRVDVGGTTVDAVSPASALGHALLGMSRGDSAEVTGPRSTAEWEILQIL